MTTVRVALVVGCAIVLTACASSEPSSDHSNVDSTALVALVNQMQDIVSGPAGDRDWDGLRALFLVDAVLQGVHPVPESPLPRIRTQTLDAWLVGAVEYFLTAPLYERQVDARVVVDGPFGAVLSRYESRTHPDSAPYQTGINAFVFVRTPAGWRIAALTNHDTD